MRRSGATAPLLGLAAIAGLFGVLMLAAAGQGTPEFSSSPSESTAPPPEDVVLPVPSTTGTPPPPESWGDSALAQILGVVFGAPMTAAPDENPTEFMARVRAQVIAMHDEHSPRILGTTSKKEKQ